MQAYFPLAPSFSGAGRRRKENEGLALRVHGKDVKFSIRQGMMVRREKKRGNSSDPRTLGRKGTIVLVFAAARVLSGH